jgi:hypothetical protein
MSRAPYFHLSFRPNVALVSTVRRFIGEFYRKVFIVDEDLAQQLAMATHEMLENAVAYSTDDETEICIEIVGNVLSVKTWNRSFPDRIARVRTMIDEMNSEPDGDKFYQALLIRTSKHRNSSGLGLARVRAEAEMQVRYEVDNDRVCIIATKLLAKGFPS